MSLNNLKKEIEAALLIIEWSPTEADLNNISLNIRLAGKSLTKRDLSQIVHDVYGPYECVMMEGADTADLITLLLLATKTNK